MTKNALLFLMIPLIPIQLSAGGFSISIGVNHSWLVLRDPDFPFPVENQFRPSYSIGVNSIQQIFQDVELSIGLRLFNVGRRDDNTIDGSEYNYRLHHLYISLPIRAGYEIIEGFYPFVGVEVGVQLHSGYLLTNSSGLNQKRTFTDEMNRFNIFTGFGLKYLFHVVQHQFGLSGQFNFGLLRVSRDERFDVTDTGSRGWVDWRTREVVIHVEYYFDI